MRRRVVISRPLQRQRAAPAPASRGSASALGLPVPPPPSGSARRVAASAGSDYGTYSTALRAGPYTVGVYLRGYTVSFCLMLHALPRTVGTYLNAGLSFQ